MARIPKEILLTFYTLNIESGQAKLAKAEYHLCGIKLTNKHDKQRKSFFNPIFLLFIYLFLHMLGLNSWQINHVAIAFLFTSTLYIPV